MNRRLLPLLCLVPTACYDGLDIHATLSLADRSAQVERRWVNLHANAVECADAPACVEKMRGIVDEQKAKVENVGGTVQAAGFAFHDGLADLVVRSRVPLDAPLGQEGIDFLVIRERSPADVAKGGTGRERLAFAVFKVKDAEEKLLVSGKWTLFEDPGPEGRRTFVLRGETAEVTASWRGEDPAEPAWIPAMAGLEAGLRAAGLVLDR
jgi:hypothetical protein